MAIMVDVLPADLMMDCLDAFYSVLNQGGHIVVDRMSEGRVSEVFLDFCKAKGLPFRTFKTRYESAIAERTFSG
jgi:hypothetical protein